jgi:predicted HTH transcriptional regulator
MPTIPDQHFESLTTVAAIHALIGKTEEDEDASGLLPKAACGFANGDGGVIVIGMIAKAGPNKDDPDQIQSPQPVADTTLVKTRIQDLIGQLVEPGIAGVRVAEINEPAGTKSGVCHCSDSRN